MKQTRCKICGKSLTKVQMQRRGKFCSHVCSGKASHRGVVRRKRFAELSPKVCALSGCENELTRVQIMRGSRFCSVTCSTKGQTRVTGEKHPRWKGELPIKVCALFECENRLTKSQIRYGCRFCSPLCGLKGKRTLNGEEHPFWQGGIPYQEGPRVRVKGRGTRVSRLIMEDIVNRELTVEEVVHHIDGNTSNNEPKNLHLFPSNGEHIHFHHMIRKMGREKAHEAYQMETEMET